MKLPFNSGKTGIAVAIFIVIAVLSYATQCHGQGVTVSVGSAFLRPAAATVQFAWVWPALQSKDAHFETSITAIGSSTLDGAGEQTNQFALSAVYVDGFGNFDIGIGPAFLQNTDAYNSKGANFNLLLGYHYRKGFVRWCHFSNMGTQKPNLGRDLLMIGWVF